MSATLRSSIVAALVACMCLAATGAAAWNTQRRTAQDAAREFTFEAQRVEDSAREEIDAHLRALGDVKAYVNSTWPGTSAGFRRFVAETWSAERYPAMSSSAGFIERVPVDELSAVVARELVEDPNYQVTLTSPVPAGEDLLLLNRTAEDMAGGVRIRGLEIRPAAQLLEVDPSAVTDGLAIVPIGPEAMVVAEPLGLDPTGDYLDAGIDGTDVLLLAPVTADDGTLRGWLLAPARLGNLVLSASGISSSPLALDIAVVDDRVEGPVASFVPDGEVAWADAFHSTQIAFDAGGLAWTVRAWAGPDFGIPEGALKQSTVWALGALISALVAALTFVRMVHSDRLADTRFELQLTRALAQTDALTGLLNRQGLEQRLESDPVLANGGAVLFIDLDGFKAINDLQGHSAGDRAIVDMARSAREAVRDGDLLARLGGDEFIAICPGLNDESSARPVADRVCVGLKETGWVGVTASVGVALVTPGSAMSLDSLIARADAAMYEAKRAGGGQVVYASS